jgi:hypothetical protein
MTATIVRRLCDGEELVTDCQESLPLLEGDPRDLLLSRRRATATSDYDARVRPGHDLPLRPLPPEAR